MTVPTARMIALGEAADAAWKASPEAAGSAIAEAVRALKRVVRRAATLPGMEPFEIDQSRGPRIEFTGRVIASSSHTMRDGRALAYEIFETAGGALIATVTMDGEAAGSDEICDVIVVPPSDDVQAMHFAVMDFLRWDPRARSMVRKLDWSLRLDVA